MSVPQIIWRQATDRADTEGLVARRIRLDLPTDDRSPAELRILHACAMRGVPSVSGANTPKEDAIGLLMLAAEVEHALMVQYLYAAQSVPRPLSQTIRSIAVEEMGHLITIQNLLLALTGDTTAASVSRVHLGRDTLRRASTSNPLPFTLEKVSGLTLAKFVIAERPADISDPAIRQRVQQMEAEVAAAGVDPNPVFALYAAIRWLFQPSDEPVGDLALAPLGCFKPGWHVKPTDFADEQVIRRYASTEAEWLGQSGDRDVIVLAATNPMQAVQAIDEISEQGEGPRGNDQSHFARFRLAYEDFAGGNLPEVIDLPRTPYVSGQPVPDDHEATRITNRYTGLWAQMFNANYELMLVDIAWAIGQPHDQTARARMIRHSLNTMHHAVGAFAAEMALRFIDDQRSRPAGPTFGLHNESMPASAAEFTTRYRDLADRVSALAQQIRQSPEFSSDFDGKVRLKTIADIGSKRNDILETTEPQ